MSSSSFRSPHSGGAGAGGGGGYRGYRGRGGRGGGGGGYYRNQSGGQQQQSSSSSSYQQEQQIYGDQKTSVCLHFSMMGDCRFGERCRFGHQLRSVGGESAAHSRAGIYAAVISTIDSNLARLLPPLDAGFSMQQQVQGINDNQGVASGHGLTHYELFTGGKDRMLKRWILMPCYSTSSASATASKSSRTAGTRGINIEMGEITGPQSSSGVVSSSYPSYQPGVDLDGFSLLPADAAGVAASGVASGVAAGGGCGGGSTSSFVGGQSSSSSSTFPPSMVRPNNMMSTTSSTNITNHHPPIEEEPPLVFYDLVLAWSYQTQNPVTAMLHTPQCLIIGCCKGSLLMLSRTTGTFSTLGLGGEHNSDVNSILVVENILVTADWSGQICFWKLTSSNNSEMMVMASGSGSSTFSVVSKLNLDAPIKCLEFLNLPDQKLLWAGCVGSIKLVDLSTMTVIRQIQLQGGSTDVCMSLLRVENNMMSANLRNSHFSAFSSDGSQTILSKSFNEIINKGRISNKNDSTANSNGLSAMTGMLSRNFGPLVISGTSTGGLVAVSIPSMQLVADLDAHESEIRCMSVIDDVLVTCGMDGQIGLWRWSSRSDPPPWADPPPPSAPPAPPARNPPQQRGGYPPRNRRN